MRPPVFSVTPVALEVEDLSADGGDVVVVLAPADVELDFVDRPAIIVVHMNSRLYDIFLGHACVVYYDLQCIILRDAFLNAECYGLTAYAESLHRTCCESR